MLGSNQGSKTWNMLVVESLVYYVDLYVADFFRACKS